MKRHKIPETVKTRFSIDAHGDMQADSIKAIDYDAMRKQHRKDVAESQIQQQELQGWMNA